MSKFDILWVKCDLIGLEPVSSVWVLCAQCSIIVLYELHLLFLCTVSTYGCISLCLDTFLSRSLCSVRQYGACCFLFFFFTLQDKYTQAPSLSCKYFCLFCDVCTTHISISCFSCCTFMFSVK